MIAGILNLDKPAGISSARTVGAVKRLLPERAKIGHAGTLDPFATGVLLLLVGAATRQCESLMDQPKRYDAVLKLGFTTATGDPESPEEPLPGAAIPTLDELRQAARSFKGMIAQTPPIYSAVKVGGRPAYALTRAGTPPKLAPRPVRIYDIQIVEYVYPELRFTVECGRGTYIRTLANDLARSVGSAAYLRALRRTRVGRFDIDQATTLNAVTAANVTDLLDRQDQNHPS